MKRRMRLRDDEKEDPWLTIWKTSDFVVFGIDHFSNYIRENEQQFSSHRHGQSLELNVYLIFISGYQPLSVRVPLNSPKL